MATKINSTDQELQLISDNATNIDTVRHADTTKDATAQARIENAPPAESPSKLTANQPFYRNIKRIALVVIGICVCIGAVLSKVTLVSITGRMFNLVSSRDGHKHTLPQSVLFVQLTLILVIPEVFSFTRCLIWGVIGKTTESFPWPSRSAIIRVSQCTESEQLYIQLYTYIIVIIIT